MKPTVIAALAGAMVALASGGIAAANPLPPGWTEIQCVTLDARQIVLNVTTGKELPASPAGTYVIGPYTAKLVDGVLVDATTNVPLPVTNGAVVDQAGKPIVMVSYWQRIACPPGVSIGQPGPQGPAGATGPPGLPAVQVTTTPQYVPGAAVTAGTPSATAPKTTVAPKKVTKRVTRKKVPKPVARAVVTPAVVG